MTRAPRLARRPDAVIFDMDGLMLDTERLAPRAWSDAATAMGVAFDMTLITPLVVLNFRDCSALFVGRRGPACPTAELVRA